MFAMLRRVRRFDFSDRPIGSLAFTLKKRTAFWFHTRYQAITISTLAKGPTGFVIASIPVIGIDTRRDRPDLRIRLCKTIGFRISVLSWFIAIFHFLAYAIEPFRGTLIAAAHGYSVDRGIG